MNSDVRTVLAESLKGKGAILPDLHTLFQSRPKAVNVHVDVLRRDVNERLERSVHLWLRGKKG